MSDKRNEPTSVLGVIGVIMVVAIGGYCGIRGLSWGIGQFEAFDHDYHAVAKMCKENPNIALEVEEALKDGKLTMNEAEALKTAGLTASIRAVVEEQRPKFKGYQPIQLEEDEAPTKEVEPPADLVDGFRYSSVKAMVERFPKLRRNAVDAMSDGYMTNTEYKVLTDNYDLLNGTSGHAELVDYLKQKGEQDDNENKTGGANDD